MTLPRVHAVTDARALALPAFLSMARRIALHGPRVAIHLRDRTASGRALSDRGVALREVLDGTGTALIVNARPDIAAALSADGVQLGDGDLAVPDARRVLPRGWIGRSVHSVEEARDAEREGVDYLLAGTIYRSLTHEDQEPRGTPFLTDVAARGARVLAIGGVTPERCRAIRESGAYGVAAIRSIWDAADPAAAVEAMLEPWETDR